MASTIVTRRYNPGVPIASSAPTRIDLAGGTIDIWPIYLFHDGASTLNAAISIRAHATIEPRTDGCIVLESTDTARRVTVRDRSGLTGATELPLLALLARYFELDASTLTTR